VQKKLEKKSSMSLRTKPRTIKNKQKEVPTGSLWKRSRRENNYQRGKRDSGKRSGAWKLIRGGWQCPGEGSEKCSSGIGSGGLGILPTQVAKGKKRVGRKASRKKKADRDEEFTGGRRWKKGKGKKD